MSGGRTFASLAVHNYRAWFLAALVSNIGTWMGRTAQAWLVLTILTDHSATALGWTTALQFGPMLFLAPYGGVLADRFDKRRILLVTQVLLGLQQLALWAVVATGTVQLWHVYAAAGAMAVITAVDNPARQAFASEMVGPALLSNAVGLNSASFNFARLLGPGLAGLMIAAWGVSTAMLLNALSFVAVIAALLTMHPDELMPAPPRRGRGALVEGFRYLRHRPDINLVIVCVFVFGALGMNFQVTMALMTTTVFHRGAAEYGILGSIMAIGSLTAALLAARRKRPRLSVLLGALGGFAVAAGALSLAPSYPAFAVLLVPTGMVSILALNTANARVQLAVDPMFRGRVMALYMAIFQGSTLLGAPTIGWIGDHWGARWTIGVGAVASGLTALGALGWMLATHQTTVTHLRTLLAWWSHEPEADATPVGESAALR